MKKIYEYSTCLLILSFVFSNNACSPIYYVPNPQNVPLFTEKGEGRISASFVTSDNTSGINLSGAHSFSKHFGVAGQVFLVGYDGLFPDRKTRKGHSIDAGLVYFLPFGDLELFVFESTVGFGGGAATNKDNNDYGYGDSKVGFTNFYLQPSLGLASKNFDLALSTKYSILSYHNLVIYRPQSDNEYSYPGSKAYSLLEPAITARVGWKHVKLQLQYVYSFNLSKASLSRDVQNFNFGLYFMLTDKYSTKP